MKKIKINLTGKGLLSMRDIGYAVEEKLKEMQYLGTRPIDGSRHMIFQLGNTIFQETNIKRHYKGVGICLSEIKEIA